MPQNTWLITCAIWPRIHSLILEQNGVITSAPICWDMIERISGKSLREYVKESVLLPLGMNDTDWFYGPEALSKFVKATSLVDGKLEAASNVFSEATISKEQTYTRRRLRAKWSD